MIVFRKRRLIEEQKSDFRDLLRRLCNLLKIMKYKTLPLALNLHIYMQG